MASSPKPTQTPHTFSARQLLLCLMVSMLSLSPMLAVYLVELWKRPHYQFFPLAFLAVGWFVIRSWPRTDHLAVRPSGSSTLLLLLGCASAVTAYLFVAPWFCMLGVCLIVSGFLTMIFDTNSNRSLGFAALPLFSILLIPLNGDYEFLSFLHRPSSDYASRLLEVRGIGHLLTGTTIEMTDASYNIENASRGIQSCFVLIFFATCIASFNKRKPFSIIFFGCQRVSRCFNYERGSHTSHSVGRSLFEN